MRSLKKSDFVRLLKKELKALNEVSKETVFFIIPNTYNNRNYCSIYRVISEKSNEEYTNVHYLEYCCDLGIIRYPTACSTYNFISSAITEQKKISKEHYSKFLTKVLSTLDGFNEKGLETVLDLDTKHRNS